MTRLACDLSQTAKRSRSLAALVCTSGSRSAVERDFRVRGWDDLQFGAGHRFYSDKGYFAIHLSGWQEVHRVISRLCGKCGCNYATEDDAQQPNFQGPAKRAPRSTWEVSHD